MNKNQIFKIHSVTTVRAAKNHVCDFSGVEIEKGSDYICIKYCVNSDTPNRTYHISPVSMSDFVKTNLFMKEGNEQRELMVKLSVLATEIADKINAFNETQGTFLSADDIMLTIKSA